MFLSDRFKKIIDLSYPRHGAFTQLEAATGISRATWSATYNGRNEPTGRTLEALCGQFPEYTLWLMTEQTNEAAGQTSPDIEQLRELEKKVAGK